MNVELDFQGHNINISSFFLTKDIESIFFFVETNVGHPDRNKWWELSNRQKKIKKGLNKPKKEKSPD